MQEGYDIKQLSEESSDVESNLKEGRRGQGQLVFF